MGHDVSHTDTPPAARQHDQLVELLQENNEQAIIQEKIKKLELRKKELSENSEIDDSEEQRQKYEAPGWLAILLLFTIILSRVNIALNCCFKGEMGKPVIIDKEKLSPEEKEKYEAGWKRNMFNEYVSDMISLNRSLPDLRYEECKQINWYRPLPSVSVIIIFHNEALSALLRTVHSVINRSDPSLLKEVILVDDASTFGIHFLSTGCSILFRVLFSQFISAT
jgi:hypothetical protein